MDFRDFIPQLQLIRPPSRRVVSATTGALVREIVRRQAGHSAA
jgi:hypothetical protein